MKQIVQYLDSGETVLFEAPSPSSTDDTLLIRTNASLISTGTERMLVGFGKASMLRKAKQQPDRVKEVLKKVRTDGAMATFNAVKSKLAQPIPLGYCNVGEVIAVGKNVRGFNVGDRVASNGPHADIVRVPQNLAAAIPDSVTDETAAFTVVGSIGLQGIRLLAPTLGEAIVVIGAGLIGLLTVQLLRAQGCRVLAVDFDEDKLAVAKSFGAEICNPAQGQDAVTSGVAFSRGAGVDGVIVTASTSSSQPISDAAAMCRKRGRIVLVGVTGLELNRADFYEKELTFQVSCSYGPGRYDASYEEGGHDYPRPFVRWTEQRNFEAVLDMMAAGRVVTEKLVTREFDFEDAVKAYSALTADKSGLGFLLKYRASTADRLKSTVILNSGAHFDPTRPVVGMIGAGNYGSRVLIPALKKAGVQLHSVASSGGLSGAIAGRNDGFAQASSSHAELLANPDINTVVIATRHDSHARLAAEAIAAGKHVFVEKPLALSLDEISQVEAAIEGARASSFNLQLMVGFNRRFSPHIKRAKVLLENVDQPKTFLFTVNAGYIPKDHWTQDRNLGGGRIIGEACHFIDLMRHLAGHPIVSISGRRMGDGPAVEISTDKTSITLAFEDGSFGTILYLANGGSSFPKERIEMFVAGRTLQIDNFRKMSGFNWPGFSRLNLMQQDKGQAAGVQAFIDAVRSGIPAIPLAEILEVARTTIEIDAQLQNQ